MKMSSSFEEETLLRENEFNGVCLHSTIESLLSGLVFKKTDINSINDFYHYITSFEYDHPGLTREAYMTHPIRVAKLVIEFSENFTPKEIMLALSHNILEVTKIESHNIKNKHLRDLIPHIKTLTVNRKLQWNQAYKTQYYSQIHNSRLASTIKILDKVDNLYLLKNNPDLDIKVKYLKEIKKYIIPLSETHLPLCRDLIQDLLLYNELMLGTKDSHAL